MWGEGVSPPHPFVFFFFFVSTAWGFPGNLPSRKIKTPPAGAFRGEVPKTGKG